jgi:serine/threonine-protein kinase RsbT
MQIIKREVLKINQEQDVVLVRKLERDCANDLKFSMTNQTKLVTAASELARNIIKYATSGTVELNVIKNDDREGIQMIFENQGPGIADISKVMSGGYTTGGGLGLGLSGSKKLVNEFDLRSVVGEGTCIKLILWK